MQVLPDYSHMALNPIYLILYLKLPSFIMEVEATRMHNSGYLHDATAALILQVQDRDIQELLAASKGKGRGGQSQLQTLLRVSVYQTCHSS